jgi:hypothetical protein
MDLNKGADCIVGVCGSALGFWIGEHWMAILGALLLLWRATQAFVLEPLGIFWPRPRPRRRRS